MDMTWHHNKGPEVHVGNMMGYGPPHPHHDFAQGA